MKELASRFGLTYFILYKDDEYFDPDELQYLPNFYIAIVHFKSPDVLWYYRFDDYIL